MGWPKCNMTAEHESLDETKLPGIHITIHRLGVGLAASFGLASVVLSVYLIWRHATHYLRPYEQKQIIRILFMVPIYAVVSFLSYLYYRHSIYFQVLRDCYEAIAIASFFNLLCHYIAPNLHDQKDYFRDLAPKPWIFPFSWRRIGWTPGPLRIPRSGLTWFNIIWSGVFQYCFIRVFFTIVSVITQSFDLYCLETENPAFAHVWVTLFTAIGVTIAMYCLFTFYFQIQADISQHSPVLKLVSIKLVIFLSFWQTIAISLLTSLNVIKPSARIGASDIKIGIPSLLLCMEMAFFALLHLWAYPWKPYDVEHSRRVIEESGPGDLPTKLDYKGGRFGWRAYLDAINMIDLIRAVGRSARWVVVGRRSRTQDRSYKAANATSSTALGAGVADPGLDNETAYKGAKPKGRYERLGDNGADGYGRRGRRESRTPLVATNGQSEPVLEMGRYPTAEDRAEGRRGGAQSDGSGYRDHHGKDVEGGGGGGGGGGAYRNAPIPSSLRAPDPPRGREGQSARLGRDELGFESETGGVDTRYVSPARRGGGNEF